MIYKKAKLFWKLDDTFKVIFCVPFDDDLEYYVFLKQCHNDGYRQIIITSALMIELVEHFVMEIGLSIFDIEFMEEDQDLQSEVKDLIDKVSKNKAFLGKLITRLNFLSEKSSIDIKRIYIKGRSSENVAINFYLQSNGLIGINNESYIPISKEISSFIAGCLF